MKSLITSCCFAFLTMLGWFYQNKPLAQSISDGAQIYQDFCLQCHMARGEGVTGAFPPLAQSDYLKKELTKSIQAVKYGMRGPIVVNGATYDGIMVAQGLDNEEVADVMNYILNSWGNASERQITEKEVVTIKKP